MYIFVVISLISIAEGLVIRDVQDTINDEICDEYTPTIGRSIDNKSTQKCCSASDILGGRKYKETVVVYAKKRLHKCVIIETFIYRTHGQKWSRSENFKSTRGNDVILEKTRNNQGMFL